ncbi:MAG: response regulator transcription factor [Proteobacteria bacterium]|nr:MAG: response regulator transcription factor [Pseudomonadota bacterium]
MTATSKRLLLVEDDPTLGVTLKERLINEGYFVRWASTAQEARAAFQDKDPWDIVVFDVGLPDGSGFELAAEWKNKAPFLFVTALSDAEHRLRGFELGAEEYIPKPFHLKELLIRVRHVLENHARRRTVHAAGFEVDLDSLTVKNPQGEIERPAAKDFQVLALLIEKAPKVLTRDDILDAVWSADHLGNQRTVDNAVVRLRGLFPGINPIRSVRGVGYQWLGGEES